MKRGVLSLVLVTLLTRAYAQLPCALITPGVLRLETQETIVVDAQLQRTAFDAEIIIQDFPLKSQGLFTSKVSLNSANGFIGKVDIKIPSNDVFKDTSKKHYVNVVVRSKECALQKVVLLSFHSGYIFIQTDKPIYNPGTVVKYRLFVTGHSLEPDKRIVDVEFINPEGIVVKKDRFSSGEYPGIIEKTFNIPEITNDGIWNITSKFQVAPQEVFFTEFEVKEYVLPSFEVFLETPQNHFYVDENDFTVKITAKYLHGKPVEGFGLVLFGVILNNDKKIFPNSLRNITLNKGKAEVKLERYMIPGQYLIDPSFLLDKSLYVTTSVVTTAGSDKVEAVKTGIPIVKTAFKVLFTKTAKYFKPSMPYTLKLMLQNPNGSPAPGVEICTLENICSTTTADGTTNIVMNTKLGEREMKILVRTKAVGIPNNRQTVGSFTVTAYKPQDGSENYLHISLTADHINVDNNLQVQFYMKNKALAIQRSITHIIYMIISRGRVIKLERVPRQPDQTIIATSIVITAEYIPSFRMLAYYVVPGNKKEIVSDSVWVSTENSCIRQLELSGDPKKISLDPQPGTSVSLKLTGEPEASVGLVAVDKAVFVLNKKNQMSQNKIWSEVERSDLGCTPGSGSDSAGVFVDAGLAVESNLGLVSPTRNELRCVESPRMRRSATITSKKTAKAQEYSDPNLRKCCEDGMKENMMKYSCQRRTQFILEQGQCIKVFLACCKHIFEPQIIRGRPEVSVHRRPSIFRPVSTIDAADKAQTLNEDDYALMDTFASRSIFYESWLWKIEKLPSKADSRGYATKTFNANLPDSITTWEFMAISLSKSGICVAKPYEMLVKKSFFIDLRLPYSVVRNEQVEIRAVLHSYIDTEIEAVVDLIYNKDMCSAATAEANFRQLVKLEPSGTLILPFVIVPLKTGDIRIEIKASVKDLFQTDGVIKNLKVVPEGIRILKSIQSAILDPMRSVDTPGTQVLTIKTVTPDDIVPNTEASTYISVKGSLLGETLQNSIDGANLKHLIMVPSGCGEQIMMSMTPTVIATRFLDVTNQWEKIGVERRAEAIKNIEKGYVQQMTYRKPDNSYSAFTNRPGSTWLTAYVVKVFAMAGKLMNVEKEILCGAMKWLLDKKQLPIGAFKEDAPVIHGEMVGGSGHTDPDASLTAFVLIALVEAKSFCTSTLVDLDSKLEKSSTYLEGRLKNLKNPYSICITSYALSLVDKLSNHQQLMSSSTGGTHWAGYSADLYMIEATSYALLALLKIKQYILAEPVARWLTEQRFYGGGYGSTQATIMVFQALSEFQIHSPNMNEINMDVTLNLPGRSESITWKLYEENALVQRSERAEMKDKIIVTAKGKGQGTLTVMSLYYVPLAEGVTPCKNFDFSVTLEDVPNNVKVPIDYKKSMYINICMKYLGATDATMVIVDLTLLTGFNPDMDDLSALTNRVDKYISKYEMDTERSERGSLIIYLDSVSRTETQCLKFKIHQKFEVGILQPATVSIYEYYAIENTCTKFYHPTKEGGELKKICREAECHCISEQCNMKNTYTVKLDAVSLAKEACRHGVDYVYEAKVNKIETKGAYDIHFMTIVNVVKRGSDEVLPGEERQFFSHKSCRDLKNKFLEGRSYVIWGHSNDIWDIKKDKSYVINGRTWFEVIPTKRECGTTERSKCDELFDFMDYLMMHGCSQ